MKYCSQQLQEYDFFQENCSENLWLLFFYEEDLQQIDSSLNDSYVGPNDYKKSINSTTNISQEYQQLNPMDSGEKNQKIHSENDNIKRPLYQGSLIVDDNIGSTDESENSSNQNSQSNSSNSDAPSTILRQKVHLYNKRRRLSDKECLKILCHIAIKYCPPDKVNKIKALNNLSQLTKNLLPFAKGSHFEWIIRKKGQKYIQNNGWLKEIHDKASIELADFHLIYTCKQLHPILDQYFEKGVLYRDLMASRVEPSYKIIYSQFLKIFRKNYERQCFDGISQTKMELEKQKGVGKIKKIRKDRKRQN